jgi:hypothetical protein
MEEKFKAASARASTAISSMRLHDTSYSSESCGAETSAECKEEPEPEPDPSRNDFRNTTRAWAINSADGNLCCYRLNAPELLAVQHAMGREPLGRYGDFRGYSDYSWHFGDPNKLTEAMNQCAPVLLEMRDSDDHEHDDVSSKNDDRGAEYIPSATWKVVVGYPDSYARSRRLCMSTRPDGRPSLWDLENTELEDLADKLNIVPVILIFEQLNELPPE